MSICKIESIENNPVFENVMALRKRRQINIKLKVLVNPCRRDLNHHPVSPWFRVD